jgi:hypothetical protein
MHIVVILQDNKTWKLPDDSKTVPYKLELRGSKRFIVVDLRCDFC